MASKKLKKAATIAAGIGAAYLASQALGKKKKPTVPSNIRIAKQEGKEAAFNQMDPTKEGQRIRDTFESDTAATYENVPASKFLTTPGGFSTRTPEQVMEQMEAFGPGAKKGKFISKNGKKAKDMSKEHEDMESEAEERKEYEMEEKGYKETSSGKMKKMASGGESKAAYLAARNKKNSDRLTLSDIRDAENALKRGYPKPDVTATEGSFVRGGSVIARGNKLARSKPTKLF